jgi:hypothetical protein
MSSFQSWLVKSFPLDGQIPHITESATASRQSENFTQNNADYKDILGIREFAGNSVVIRE